QLNEIAPFVIEEEVYSPVVDSILKVKNRHFELKNKKVETLKRLGKLLYFVLEDDHYILSHLGMSGSWRISKEKLDVKHNHVELKVLSDNAGPMFLSYVDPRRFGHMYFVKGEAAKKEFARLGVDIASPQFNEEYLSPVFKKFPNKVLKPFLLDQKYFAGCGNYIASEICARAGIRPTRKCGKITQTEVSKIVAATKSVLEGSIKNNGMTFSGGYADTKGEKGEGVKDLVVFYQKVCGLCHETPVKKIVLAQRGTYYCPKCQK
ncbi:MAG: hypothetical protein NXH75_12620, partial [Halobacteriovoraceae bacterium]|nr:hypothetical protein [Halobacteriovoraceae bacterium]